MGTLRLFRAWSILVLAGFISCSDDNSDEGYFEQWSGEKVRLTIEIIPEGGGEVLPKSGTYAKGHQMTLRALPNEGYSFSFWEGEVTVSDPTHLITMDSDKTITAVFREAKNNFLDPEE